MPDEITQALQHASLHWKTKEAAVMSMGDLADQEVWLNAWLEGEYKMIKQEKQLAILGSRIDQ